MPGSRTAAAIMAMTATKDSMSIAPYPIMRTCDSFSMSFGVVPEAISAWKPESAPQATVMNTNGKRGPTGATGPPVGEEEDGPDLHERREVVAWSQEDPHR